MNTFGKIFSAAGLAVSMCAGASTPSMAALTNAPLGYQLMCLQHPSECRGGGAAAVQADMDLIGKLRHVNSLVNRSIRPRNDRGLDTWSLNVASGDCEDYVLAKRHKLIELGVPASSLRIAAVKTRSGQGHAILVVNTDQGKLVLDNMNSAIRPLEATGYRVVHMQSANPASWS